MSSGFALRARMESNSTIHSLISCLRVFAVCVGRSWNVEMWGQKRGLNYIVVDHTNTA